MSALLPYPLKPYEMIIKVHYYLLLQEWGALFQRGYSLLSQLFHYIGSRAVLWQYSCQCVNILTLFLMS